MSNAPSLALNGVHLEYPDGTGTINALDSVNLSVRPGQLAAIVGPSGSGKSSLLAVAATLIRPDSGSVGIGGVDVTRLSERARAALRREKLGIVFQQPNLLASLNAVEQLLISAQLRGESAKTARQRAIGLLDLVGLADCAGKRPHQLSGGQRQRVNIARALIGAPEVLLVDEPTAALDHERGGAIMRLLRKVTDEFQMAAVMVTHDTEFAALADSTAEMRDGRLTALAAA